MDADSENNSRNVGIVFKDFKGRRAGILKALTTDAEEFFMQCDPEKENLCLYGFPNGQWEVNMPVEQVPPEIPEPVLGINFGRDGTSKKNWLSLVAVHSDSWLLSVAFFFATTFRFDRSDRNHLFKMINDLPTVYEIVTGTEQKHTEEPSVPKPYSSNDKSKSGIKRGPDTRAEFYKSPQTKEDDLDVEEQDDEENALCGKCHENYSDDEFWIWCDMCTTWFHGKCVKISQAKAAQIEHYKCPSCSKKLRH